MGIGNRRAAAAARELALRSIGCLCKPPVDQPPVDIYSRAHHDTTLLNMRGRKVGQGGIPATANACILPYCPLCSSNAVSRCYTRVWGAKGAGVMDTRLF